MLKTPTQPAASEIDDPAYPWCQRSNGLRGSVVPSLARPQGRPGSCAWCGRKEPFVNGPDFPCPIDAQMRWAICGFAQDHGRRWRRDFIEQMNRGIYPGHTLYQVWLILGAPGIQAISGPALLNWKVLGQ